MVCQVTIRVHGYVARRAPLTRFFFAAAVTPQLVAFHQDVAVHLSFAGRICNERALQGRSARPTSTDVVANQLFGKVDAKLKRLVPPEVIGAVWVLECPGRVDDGVHKMPEHSPPPLVGGA